MFAVVGLTSATLVLIVEIYADWKASRLRIKFQSKKSMVSALEVLSAPLQLIGRRRSLDEFALSEKQSSSETKDDSVEDGVDEMKMRKRYSFLRFYEVGIEGRTMF